MLLLQQKGFISMRSLVGFLGSILLCTLFLSTTVEGAALTTSIDPHQRSCFYAWVDKAGEKVGFYFAVQSGGSFDIDYQVHNPDDHMIVSGTKERQADLIFTGTTVGEYSFCFENAMSSFAVKIVDFDITVESEPRLTSPISATALLSEHSVPLDESISKVDTKLTQITRMQRYFRTWENRGFATVRQTSSKIVWYSIIEMIVVVGVAAAQIFVVRYLFDKGSTKRYRV